MLNIFEFNFELVIIEEVYLKSSKKYHQVIINLCIGSIGPELKEMLH